MIERCKNCASFKKINNENKSHYGFCPKLEKLIKADNPKYSYIDNPLVVFENFYCILFTDKNN